MWLIKIIVFFKIVSCNDLVVIDYRGIKCKVDDRDVRNWKEESSRIASVVRWRGIK